MYGLKLNPHCPYSLKKKNTYFSPNHDPKYSHPKKLRCLRRTKFLSRLSTLIACHKKKLSFDLQNKYQAKKWSHRQSVILAITTTTWASKPHVGSIGNYLLLYRLKEAHQSKTYVPTYLPFKSQMKFVILLTVSHTICIMLMQRICYWMN